MTRPPGFWAGASAQPWPTTSRSPAAFDAILAAAGLPEGQPPPVGAILVGLEDQLKAEEVVDDLRGSLPEYSVVTVARETAFANARHLPERSYEWFGIPQPKTLPLEQPTVPVESGDVFGLVLFGFAGLVIAGNSTLAVLTRRTEFAVLKAIGLRGFEIGLVVMAEVLTTAVIGLLIGFTAGEVSCLPMILSNSTEFGTVKLGAVLGTMASHFALVGGVVLLCAAAFSLFPVARTLRITVSEAMRGGA